MPPLVVVENLVKTYRIAQRQPGLWGAFRGVASRQHRTITALDGISFELEKVSWSVISGRTAPVSRRR